MKQNMQDLTEGPLGKKILIFSVPLMLSNLLQVLFNMADIAVIGQFAGQPPGRFRPYFRIPDPRQAFLTFVQNSGQAFP